MSLYPVTIVKTRYGGVYEGGGWAAFNRFEDDLPPDAFADDVTCSTWWMSNEAALVGVGDTPDVALSLLEGMHVNGD